MTTLELEKRITDLETDIEELFYAFYAYRNNKKTIEDVVVIAVMEFFGIKSRKDFFGLTYQKAGQPINLPEEDKSIIEARKWCLSMLRYILLKTTFSLQINFPFYHCKKLQSFRDVFEGSINPKTEKDRENRKKLLGIGKIIKRIAKEEGILSDEFDQL